MYGDFPTPHQIAIELANELGVEAWIFELGYIRPQHVTLERNRVNARSNLNKPVEFYHALPKVRQSPATPLQQDSDRWLKLCRVPYFIQHAFADFEIVDGPHKLKPKPSYLYFQFLGYIREPWYALTERRARALLRTVPNLFLAVLQVSIDSQVTMASSYLDMRHFIQDVLASFSRHSLPDQHLVFKHHPCDRGYNNYKRFIQGESARLGVTGRVHYIHDDSLAELFRCCKGVVTINSTVGLTALKYNVPTKVMGKTFYNLPGLTVQEPLDSFWQGKHKIDRRLFLKFYNYLVEHTQINGSFNGYFPFEETIVFKRPVPARAEIAREVI
jgi:capsular polysaccharide export protein